MKPLTLCLDPPVATPPSMRVLDDHASHVIVEGVVEGDLCEALSLHPRAESLCVRNSWVRLGGDGTRSYPAVRTLVIRNVWMDEPLDVSRLVALLPNLQILVLCDVCDVVMTHHLARLRSLEWVCVRRNAGFARSSLPRPVGRSPRGRRMVAHRRGCGARTDACAPRCHAQVHHHHRAIDCPSR